MLTLSKFRKHFFQLFRIMVATDMYVDVSFRGHVYRIYAENMHRKVKTRQSLNDLRDRVESEECEECGGLSINGVCMSDCEDSGD